MFAFLFWLFIRIFSHIVKQKLQKTPQKTKNNFDVTKQKQLTN